MKKATPSLLAGVRNGEVLRRRIIARLALVSAFLAAVDTIQSYYGQRVVNVFNEANLLPVRFYNYGVAGYALYAPIDFLSIFGTLLALWAWASYVLWYRRNFSLSLFPPRITTKG
jgi:hypothetical protein